MQPVGSALPVPFGGMLPEGTSTEDIGVSSQNEGGTNPFEQHLSQEERRNFRSAFSLYDAYSHSQL